MSVAEPVPALMVQQHFVQVCGRWRSYTDLWSRRTSVGLGSQCKFFSSHAHTHTCQPFPPRTGKLYSALFSCSPVTKGVQCKSFLGIPRAVHLSTPAFFPWLCTLSTFLCPHQDDPGEKPNFLQIIPTPNPRCTHT